MKHQFGTTEHFQALITSLDGVDTKASSFNLSPKNYFDANKYTNRFIRIALSDAERFNRIFGGKFNKLKTYNMFKDEDYFSGVNRIKTEIFKLPPNSQDSFSSTKAAINIRINNEVKAHMIEMYLHFIKSLKEVSPEVATPSQICEEYTEEMENLIKKRLTQLAFDNFGEAISEIDWISKDELERIILNRNKENSDSKRFSIISKEKQDQQIEKLESQCKELSLKLEQLKAINLNKKKGFFGKLIEKISLKLTKA